MFDDLAVDPVGCFASVCRFVGVDSSITPPVVGRVFNAGSVRDEDAQMPPEVRAALLDYYRPFNAALARWLDVDLADWGR